MACQTLIGEVAGQAAVGELVRQTLVEEVAGQVAVGELGHQILVEEVAGQVAAGDQTLVGEVAGQVDNCAMNVCLDTSVVHMNGKKMVDLHDHRRKGLEG